MDWLMPHGSRSLRDNELDWLLSGPSQRESLKEGAWRGPDLRYHAHT